MAELGGIIRNDVCLSVIKQDEGILVSIGKRIKGDDGKYELTPLLNPEQGDIEDAISCLMGFCDFCKKSK
jgi:hypothetical protein